MSSHILTELAEICTGAVIIERGRILRAGSLDTIMAGDAEQRTLIVRSLGAIEELHRALLELPGVARAVPDDDAVRVDFAGSEEGASELLVQLIQRGIRIAEFHQERANLEDLFMTVTTG